MPGEPGAADGLTGWGLLRLGAGSGVLWCALVCSGEGCVCECVLWLWESRRGQCALAACGSPALLPSGFRWRGLALWRAGVLRAVAGCLSACSFDGAGLQTVRSGSQWQVGQTPTDSGAAAARWSARKESDSATD